MQDTRPLRIALPDREAGSYQVELRREIDAAPPILVSRDELAIELSEDDTLVVALPYQPRETVRKAMAASTLGLRHGSERPTVRGRGTPGSVALDRLI